MDCKNDGCSVPDVNWCTHEDRYEVVDFTLRAPSLLECFATSSRSDPSLAHRGRDLTAR